MEFLVWAGGVLGSTVVLYFIVRILTAAYFRSLEDHNERTKKHGTQTNK